MMATWALTKIRMRLAARNRLFLFFSLLMPMLFLIGAVIFIKERGGPVSNYILGALLTVTVMGSFWGLSVQLVTFREQGILRRFRLAPVGAGPMLASSILSNYVMAIPTLLVEVMVCRWVLHITNWGNPWAMAVLATFGSAAFSAFGLIVASVTNTMQETQVINQLIWMAFLFLSGATVPLNFLPRWIQHATLFSPATYLATGLEASSTGVIASADFATDTVGLAVTVLVCFEISRRLFRWEPEAKVPPRAKLWVVAALVPFFLFGIFENFHGGMLRRVDTSFRAVLGDDHRDTPPPSQYSPQPSDAR